MSIDHSGCEGRAALLHDVQIWLTCTSYYQKRQFPLILLEVENPTALRKSLVSKAYLFSYNFVEVLDF